MMTEREALAEFGVGLKSESFTPWITLITLNKEFWPWTSKQGILNSRASRLLTAPHCHIAKHVWQAEG